MDRSYFYKTAAWLAIISIAVGFMGIFGGEAGIYFTFVSSLLSIPIIYALVLIGKKINSKFLAMAAWALLIYVIYSSIALLLIKAPEVDQAVLQSFDPNKNPFSSLSPEMTTYGIWTLVNNIFLNGAITLTIGIAMLRLKERYGSLGTTTGVLNIISGALYLVVILFFIGVLTDIAALICLIIVMFKESSMTVEGSTATPTENTAPAAPQAPVTPEAPAPEASEETTQ